MKKVIVFVFAIISINSTQAQTAYEDAMQKGLSLLAQNKLDTASNIFERISKNSKQEWLPAYYAAKANIDACFQTKDKNTMDLKINKADQYLKIAEQIATNNSEIIALRGLYYTALLAFDPQTNGMKYSGLTVATYQKAIALDSLNPRAQSGALDFQLGMDRFFKKDLTPYCAKFKAILPLFNQKSKYKFAPTWGKSNVQYRIQNLCGSKKTTTPKGHDIKVVITGFSNNKGTLKIALYDSQTNFLSTTKTIKTVNIIDKQATITFKNIPNGVYAISCYHDVNGNNRLDRNGYGAPTEPYAFSNDARGTMGPPTWDDSKFEVKDKAITIKLTL